MAYKLGFLKNNPLYKYHYFLPKIIKKGDHIIDIGGNLGYFTVLFSKLAGSEGVVKTIEPVKPVLEVLSKNTKRLKNVDIYPYALGNENKKVRLGNNTKLKTGYVSSGSHFILDTTDNESAEIEFEAEMRKGSELFADMKQINFIKCDVEGYETVIIPEMESIMRRQKPTMLIETKRKKRKMMIDYLRKLGFEGYVLEKSKLIPAEAIKEKLGDDILFIHQDNLESYLKYIR